MVLHLLGLKLICQVFSSPLTAVGTVAAVPGCTRRSCFVFFNLEEAFANNLTLENLTASGRSLV